MDSITEWGRLAAEQDLIAANAKNPEDRELAVIYAEGYRSFQAEALKADEICQKAFVNYINRSVARGIISEMEGL